MEVILCMTPPWTWEKSPARVWARPRGKYWRALRGANLARYHSLVGAVALGGNPRKLLTPWCGRKKPRTRGLERGSSALGLGARNSAPTPVSHCSLAQRKRAARKPTRSLTAVPQRGADLGEMRFIGRLAPCSTSQNVTDGPWRDVEAARYLGRA
jgi:hypothetical protein